MLSRIFPNDRTIEDGDWPCFARRFLRERIASARKDLDICLTGQRHPSGKGTTHAYFPALMVCMGLLELLSGLHDGNLEKLEFRTVGRFREKFLKTTTRVAGVYDDSRLLGLLIAGFRHKVAHLAHPYIVFDTRRTTNRHIRSLLEPHICVAWEIKKGRSDDCALSLVGKQGRHVETHETPWPVPYNAVFKVSLSALFADVCRACLDPHNGYLTHLVSSDEAMTRFRCCMEQFFPRTQESVSMNVRCYA